MKTATSLLGFTSSLLRLLVLLNLAFGAGILAMLVASLVAQDWLLLAIGVRGEAGPALAWGMRAVMLLGLGGVALSHLILVRLRAIVATVGAGDPFVAANAERLRAIAWALLGIALLHLAVGAAAPLDIGWSFNMSGWLAVLLLFVLARVFELGTAMRADLEGTV
ncbi:MAG: DUF2975 domain-containing protein [Sphingosinicella sp.]